MLGAILGDIAGSKYEYDECMTSYNTINVERRKSMLNLSESQIWDKDCFFTDDTVLTIAVADSLLNAIPYEENLRKYGNRFLKLNLGKANSFECPFSPNFQNWLRSCEEGKSIGNGSCMRISPIGYLLNDIASIEFEVIQCTIPSHNTEEAICGANAIADTILMARRKVTKQYIKQYVQSNYNYDLNFSLEYLQENNVFDPTAKGTAPIAIFVFLQSNSFEDAIKKALSIGGDTDTIACIVGSIAEAYFGIPKSIKSYIYNYNLPKDFLKILQKAYQRVDKKL